MNCSVLRRGRQIAVLASIMFLAIHVHAANLFFDGFDVTGNRLDETKWTTEVGPSSFLGRTQLQDWVSPGSIGSFPVVGGEAQMSLSTYNPTGFSMYGTHAKTLPSFAPSAGTQIELVVRMQLTTIQPGLVFGVYFFGCDAGLCASHHDELDIELVTNYLQPSQAPMRVQLNRYAAEPLGAGHGPIVALPAGFDPLSVHEWKIVWGREAVTYFIDDVALFTATDTIPQGSMKANIIAWGPASEWADAFDSALQPTSSAALEQRFTARVDSLSVNQISAVPEPSESILFLIGIVVVVGRKRAYSSMRRDIGRWRTILEFATGHDESIHFVGRS